MSWLTTAASGGAALGAALAGRLIDSHGAGAGYLLAFAVGMIALGIAILRRRHLAASRHRSRSSQRIVTPAASPNVAKNHSGHNHLLHDRRGHSQ